MTKKISSVVALFFGIILCIFLLNKKYSFHQENKPFILCTTGIIGGTVQRIVGDTAQVHALMGPGIDPHLYKAREGDVHRLANADMIFYNGLHLEGKMAHVLEQMNRYAPSIALSDTLPTTALLQTEVDGIYDPHIWHDVILWIKIVEYATTCLCKRWPEQAELYTQNSQTFCEELHALDAYARKQIATIDPKKTHFNHRT